MLEMFGAWLLGDTTARLEGRPSSKSLDELRARVVPGYQGIVDRHRDEDGVVAIVGHGGSIGWVLPSFAANVSLPFGLTNGLANTGIIDVALDASGTPFVTEWDGIAFEANGPVVAPVPLPAGGLLLLTAIGGLAVRRIARGPGRASQPV